MSSQIFINYTDDNSEEHFLELTCSTEVQVSYKNKVTTNPVEKGANISDHVDRLPAHISIVGVITNIRNYALDYYMEPADLIKSLRELRDSGKLFTVAVEDSLDPFPNCQFDQLHLTKSSGQGVGWGGRMSIQQIRLSKSSILSEFPEQAEEVEDQHATKTQQGDNGTEEDRNEETSTLSKLSSFIISSAFSDPEEQEVDPIEGEF